MKIANIIYEKELVNHTNLEYINYFNENIEYEKLDKTLPTLYVGWSFMKDCNPNNSVIQNADILRKKIIINELYWEFSFEESKNSHVNGIESFAIKAPQLYFSPKYEYINVDPVFLEITNFTELNLILPKEIYVCYNYKNEMLYLLKDNKIWGVNLLFYSFFKFDINQIIEEISIRSENLINDLDASLYNTQYKIFPEFSFLRRYLPIILSK